METEALPHDAADLRLAERLRALRRARRWSLDELSALSGVSRASLSRIENGDVSPMREFSRASRPLQQVSRLTATNIHARLRP